MTRTFWILLVVIAGTYVGCKPVQPLAQSHLFVISFSTLRNPFFVELNASLKAAIEARGDRLITLDAQYNSEKQRNGVLAALSQQPSMVFINPVNWETIKATLIEVRRMKIQVIIVDAPVSDPDLVLCQVASDNVKAGRLACEALSQVNPTAKVAVLQHSVNKASIDRVAGFRSEMARYPAMKIVDIQEGKGNAEGSQGMMASLLRRYPEIDAAFPINDPSALGAIAAIEEAGRRGHVTVVTVDGSQQGVSAILQGRLYASVAQDAGEIGRLAAESAYAHLAGYSVEKDVKVPVRLITRENATLTREAK
ncbi:MAG TPA: substrate-binding domain-containing protein [Opitutaceae bacterium]|nr:substrate-binding domain-containing protein [Opitutaceae bacterium]